MLRFAPTPGRLGVNFVNSLENDRQKTVNELLPCKRPLIQASVNQKGFFGFSVQLITAKVGGVG